MSIHVFSLSACLSVIDSSCAIAELLSRDVNHSCRAKKRLKVSKESNQNVLLHGVKILLEHRDIIYSARVISDPKKHQSLFD